MKSVPLAPNLETEGMMYFARMLDKIRKKASGELREDFVPRMGEGFDALCCGFLRVDYPTLTERVLAGGTDEEILQWCFDEGRKLDTSDLMIWNNYLQKVGWRDFASERLKEFKEEGGFADRDDIDTIFAFMDADEGRS
ncbi:DUF5069 domain-containing protein [Ruficoccus amylovorans]|uniref:DUF5069 domain-containing protein n=1 Tax=Ruficoccus amylovorans TaxID=1804625 RepID=A0A842HC83_9BACT|nr:DUF5069 domain-containing protein [Ruficoccus amylovorans]MBC2593678.1 DUF5069 domain-containing protein [Ruficoccus amylovorans]